MNFLSPMPGATVAVVAAIAAALAIVAYIIKMRRRRFEVPFANLWKRVLDQRDANVLWKQLKRLMSLLLLLTILALIFVAALGPTLGARDAKARSVVVLIDASASMKAQDGDPKRPKLTRMERARERAKALIDSMGGGDLAMIMRVDGQATPVSRFDGDKPMLRKVIDEIQPVDTPADLPRALSAAADALRGRQNPLIVIVSDGAYSEQQRKLVAWEKPAEVAPAPDAAGFQMKELAAVDLSGIDVRFLGVGSRSENVGIVAFNVRRYIANKAAYEVFIEVQNFGSEPAARELALYNGDTAIEVKPLTIGAGKRVREIYRELPGGESTLRASLRPPADRVPEGVSGSDPFPLDDQAWALLPARKNQAVLIVTRGNKYLTEAMDVYDNIVIEIITPDAYDAAPEQVVMNPSTGRPYDVVVFDDHTPAVRPAPPSNLLYFHPTGEHSPFASRGVVPRPRITETDKDHQVMRWVELSDVNIDQSEIFVPDRGKGEVALAYYVRDAVAAAGRERGRKIVALGWSLGGTDLTLRVAFPLLLVNTLDWFAGDDADLVTTYTTGQRFRIPLDGLVSHTEITVIDPAGRRTQAPVREGMATFYGQRVGIHQILAYDPEEEAPPPGRPDPRSPVASFDLAANLSSTAESNIKPEPALTLGDRKLAEPAGFAVSARRDLWIYLVLAALALLMLEWVTYHRRITV